jgi:hypothetical protein
MSIPVRRGVWVGGALCECVLCAPCADVARAPAATPPLPAGAKPIWRDNFNRKQLGSWAQGNISIRSCASS